MKNKRLILPDLIKGLAVLLMIQVHIMELFARQDVYDGFSGQISLFLGGIPAAPVFMLMMGYLMALKSKSSVDMLKRGIRLFIGGIFLNIGMNFHLIYNIIFKNWNYNLWNYVFGADILTLAGLSLIIFVLIHKLANDNYLIYFIIAFIIAILRYFFSSLDLETSYWRYVLSFITGGTSWSYFPLIPWLAYPVLGYGLKLLNNKYSFSSIMNKFWSNLALILISLTLILSFNYGFSNSYLLTNYYHHRMLFFLWAMAFMIVWFYGWYQISGLLKSTIFFEFLLFLGKNVTSIYVIQWLIIGNLSTEFYKTKNLEESVMWFFVILFISSTSTYFISQTRFYFTSKKLQKIE